jgi:hypothetical protein
MALLRGLADALGVGRDGMALRRRLAEALGSSREGPALLRALAAALDGWAPVLSNRETAYVRVRVT